MRLIRTNTMFQKGEFMNKWFSSRVGHNKNVLCAFCGSTGSGKSFSCLSVAELWYSYNFKEEYDVNNVCFSIGELAKRINTLNKAGKLRKGELFIMEEAGANFGSLDFQNKLNKMFGYMLQTFRSMNLIVLMNLPVLTMLNKSARQLIHGHFITSGIDYDSQETHVKAFLHQLSQLNGKSYWKYPKVNINGKNVKLQILKFPKPSDNLIELYEKKKGEFVFTLTEDLVNEVENDESEKKWKIAKERKGLSERETQVIELLVDGLDRDGCAARLGCSRSNINHVLANAYKKGYDYEEYIKKRQNEKLQMNDTLTVRTP